jgi:hypothetical protein
MQGTITNTSTKPKNSLRPYTLLEILDRTFRIYRDNFATFVGLVAVVTIPLTVVNVLGTFWMLERLSRSGLDLNSISSGRADPRAFNTTNMSNLFGELLTAYAAFFVLLVVVSLLQAILINGPLTYIASERFLGRKVGIGEAVRVVSKRLSRLGVGLILYYAILVMLGIVMVPIAFACGLGFGVLLYLGVTMYAFLVPVLILEQTGTMQGMNRAWALGRSRVWPVVGVVLLISILTWIITIALGTASDLIIRQAAASISSTTEQIISIIEQALIAIVISPVLPIGLTLLYYDTRVRTEGLDIALQSTGKPDPRPEDIISPPVESMNSKDFVNLGIFVVIPFLLFAAYVGLIFALVGGRQF